MQLSNIISIGCFRDHFLSSIHFKCKSFGCLEVVWSKCVGTGETAWLLALLAPIIKNYNNNYWFTSHSNLSNFYVNDAYLWVLYRIRVCITRNKCSKHQETDLFHSNRSILCPLDMLHQLRMIGKSFCFQRLTPSCEWRS